MLKLGDVASSLATLYRRSTLLLSRPISEILPIFPIPKSSFSIQFQLEFDMILLEQIGSWSDSRYVHCMTYEMSANYRDRRTWYTGLGRAWATPVYGTSVCYCVQIVQCLQIVQSEQHLAFDNQYRHQHPSIYSAVSAILFILLLIFSQGIVNKRSLS